MIHFDPEEKNTEHHIHHDVNTENEKPVWDGVTARMIKSQEEDFLKQLSLTVGIPYIYLVDTGAHTDAIVLIPEETARLLKMVCFQKEDTTLSIAVHDHTDPRIKFEIKKLKNSYTVKLFLASHESINYILGFYRDINSSHKMSDNMIDISDASLKEMSEKITSNADVDLLIKDALLHEEHRVSHIIEIILASAITLKSSDVHIEPEETGTVRIRYRQDGNLVDITNIPANIFRGLNSRIKILSHLKITDVSKAQDGRFSIHFNNIEIEVRVSTVPSAYGESIVMRILDPRGLTVDFDTLGMHPNLRDYLKKEIEKPNGLILTTGPTGSGKTTTLYSFLKFIYTPEKKVITIEDPIEYHITGISQTQVDHLKGYDFSAGLRAAMRQDPDVILVGEIRDKETASTAINASLTGHMVFSTLHTNNACGTIPRLLDLGVTPDILGSGLTLSIAQRLIRKLCSACRSLTPLPPDQQKIYTEFKLHAKNRGIVIPDDETFYASKGCEVCNFTGYKGRLGIYEAVSMTPEIEELLKRKPNENDIWQYALKQQFPTMAEDGIDKVRQGLTSFSELESVIDVDYYLHLYSDKTVEQNYSSIQNSIPSDFFPEKINSSGNMLYELQRTELDYLIHYLQTLETHQEKFPNVSIAEQLVILKKYLTDLMIHTPSHELFIQRSNDSTIKKDSSQIIQKINTSIDAQKQNASHDGSDDVQAIRSTLEDMYKRPASVQ